MGLDGGVGRVRTCCAGLALREGRRSKTALWLESMRGEGEVARPMSYWYRIAARGDAEVMRPPVVVSPS